MASFESMASDECSPSEAVESTVVYTQEPLAFVAYLRLKPLVSQYETCKVPLESMAIELNSPHELPTESKVVFTSFDAVEKLPIAFPVFVGESADISVLLVKLKSLGE